MTGAANPAACAPVKISMSELLEWNSEASAFWRKHLEANPD